MMRQKGFYLRVFVQVCMVAIPLLFGLYAIQLGQDTNWDLQNYHLYNAYAYLHDRLLLDLAPAGRQTYFNPFLDVAYFSALSILSPMSVGFLIGVIQGLCFIFVYKISGQVLGKGREGHSLFLALAGVLSVGFLSEVGTTMHDSLTAVFPLFSLWLALLAIENISNNFRRALVLIGVSGIVMGLGCGLKLVNSMYAVAIFLGLFFIPVAWSFRLKLAFLFGISALIGLLLSNGHWFYKIWSEFGNPLFPQFNDIFHGSLVDSNPVMDLRFLPKDIYEKFFYPFLFTYNPLRVSELPYKQVSWVFGYVALLALVFTGVFTRIFASLIRSGKEGRRRLGSQAFFLVTFFGISYVVWLDMFGIYRYLVAIEILIPLLLFVAANHFFRPENTRWWAVIFISLITLVNLKGVPNWGHSNWADSAYRIEPSALSSSPEPAVVYLVGQPLAWIIPALDIKTPFIQIEPNMPVSEAYWQQAIALTEYLPGKRFVVLESARPAVFAHADKWLAKLGLYLDKGDCDPLVGYIGYQKNELLGNARREYLLCGVKFLEFTQ